MLDDCLKSSLQPSLLSLSSGFEIGGKQKNSAKKMNLFPSEHEFWENAVNVFGLKTIHSLSLQGNAPKSSVLQVCELALQWLLRQH
jgi:hypothetical protein